MEKIAMAYLERGDVVSALPILGTLAMGASGTNVQRLRRLQHARLYREATALLACFGDTEGLQALDADPLQAATALSDSDKAAICDALLNDTIPSAVFFGTSDGAEATRRLHKLRLAVHPDKCSAANAAAAVAKLHARKQAHDVAIAELKAALGTTVDAGNNNSTHGVASPSTSARWPQKPSRGTHGSPEFTLSSSSSFASGHTGAVDRGTPDPWHSTTGAPLRSGNGSPLPSSHHQQLSHSTNRGAHGNSRSRAVPPASTQLSRSVPAPRVDPEVDRLNGLISSFRSTNSSVKLQSDLSFEACASPPSATSLHTSYVVSGKDNTPEPFIPSINVGSEFSRLRDALITQLQSDCAKTGSSEAIRLECETILTEAVEQSASTQTQSHTVVRRFVVPASGLLPVLSPKSSQAPGHIKLRHGAF